jgi:acyl carrier protein
VKIRGYRIEPGEIEEALRQAPDVREAVVVARDRTGGDKQLVAYIVWQEGHAGLVEVLREQLKARLPLYMVPAAWVELEQLPLTGNGKLDRRALPPPAEVAALQGTRVAPQTALEQLLCDIWAEVLHLDEAGLEDDFFESGGHSLLATQLVVRLKEMLDVELDLRRLFEAPTVAGLLKVLTTEPSERERLERIAEIARTIADSPEDQIHNRLAFSQTASGQQRML